jgi:hypothetical protein
VNRPLRELRVVDLLAALKAVDLDFIVFGAVAVGIHGHVRGTADVDIVIAPDPENLKRLTDWLVADSAVLLLNPNRRFAEQEAEAVLAGSNASVLTSYGALDAVQRLPGLPPWGLLERAAIEIDFEGLRLKVIDRDTLIALKRSRGTHQDLADIERLEAAGG